MKLLLDQNLSPKLVPMLTEAGYEVDHVREHGLAAAADPEILALAAASGSVLVSADTDFGTLLASTRATTPSFVLIRRAVGRRVPELGSLLIENLPAVEEDIDGGAVVVFGDSTIRIRRLPIQ